MDRLGLESFHVEIRDDLSLIDLHEMPQRTEQMYRSRYWKKRVVNLMARQLLYEALVFAERYIASREYYDIFYFSYVRSSGRELTFPGTPDMSWSEKKINSKIIKEICYGIWI
jgi:E3 ubiquitin-protein ligase DOA10